MFKKQILTGALSLGLVGLMLAPVFAQNTATSTSTTSPSTNTVKIACLGTAVNAREQAIDSAMTTFTSASNAAYSARATALQQAYSQTTLSAVKAAVKTAWSTFNASMKSARKSWMAARNNAWVKFRTAAKACKAPASISDSANSASESSGQ